MMSPCFTFLRPALTLALILFVSSACGASPQSDSSGEASAQPRELLLEAEGRPGQRPEPPAFSNAERKDERRQMVEQQITRRDVNDPAVLNAMRRVPRHLLMPEAKRSSAYLDHPTPIGHGQTISQPYIVGYMTDLLELDEDDRVLEVGTGSGYQAAVLGQIVEHTVSIEIVRALAERAAGDLESLGYGNITVLHGDGYFGYPSAAPYDAIIVTAAAEHVPPPLVQQLKPGGRMVIPVTASGWTQNLMLVEKKADGSVQSRNMLPVRFVPLTRRTR